MDRIRKLFCKTVNVSGRNRHVKPLKQRKIRTDSEGEIRQRTHSLSSYYHEDYIDEDEDEEDEDEEGENKEDDDEENNISWPITIQINNRKTNEEQLEEETADDQKFNQEQTNSQNLNNDLMLQTNEMPMYGLGLNGETYYCKVVDVYDGDTCTIILVNKGGYEKHKLRLYGYDSPEMKPPLKLENRDEVKHKAYLAKMFLSSMVENRKCIFAPAIDKKGNLVKEKFGRLIGDLWTENGDKINDIMIRSGHGYEYHGGTKR